MMWPHPLLLIFLCLLSIRFHHVLSIPLQARDRSHWVTSWAAAQQNAIDDHVPSGQFDTDGRVFKNTTLRQNVHISLGGSKLRLKISNSFNENELSITAVTVALPDDDKIGGSAIKPDTVQTVTFSGDESVTVPPNGLETSDPINLSVDDDANLTVSMYFKDGQEGREPSMHSSSYTTSWLSLGNDVKARNLTDKSITSTESWFYLSAVDVLAPYSASTLVIIGDSITDGKGSTLNGNDRWPDQLFPILQSSPSTNHFAIANRGIDGNRVLHDGVGPRALDRFGSDVVATSSVGALLIYEGINDIRASSPSSSYNNKRDDNNTASSSNNERDDDDNEKRDNNTAPAVADALIHAYSQLLSRARDRDAPRLCFIATIAPFGGTDGWDDAQEAARQRVNRWIRRNEAGFDAVVDFDAALRGSGGKKTAAAQALRPAFSSDKLHPNVAGYEAMARAVAEEAFGLGG